MVCIGQEAGSRVPVTLSYGQTEVYSVTVCQDVRTKTSRILLVEKTGCRGLDAAISSLSPV